MFNASSPPIAASQALAALQPQGCDFLRVQGNRQLIKFLDKSAKQQGVNVESVQFSDSVLKINKRGKHQKRSLVITTANVYNFKESTYKRCQRAIPITSLRGLVLCRTNEEMLLQVRNSYDYRLLVVRKADAIRILCELYELLTGSKLPVDIADDLTTVQVLKADMKKARARAEPGTGKAATATSPLDEPSPMSNNPLRAALSAPNTPGANPALRGVSFIDHSGPSSSSSGNHSGGGGGGGGNSGAAASLDLRPSMEGWLTKKGQVNLLWRRRYFRLSESNLLYYEARMKGTIDLVAGGEVRAWVNKRLTTAAVAAAAAASSASATSAASPAAPSSSSSSSSSNSASSSTLAPLLYEFKLSSAYNFAPERHLRDILSDPDRLDAFVSYCETVKPQATLPTALAAAGGKPADNESGNPKFWAAAEKFKTLFGSSGVGGSGAGSVPAVAPASLQTQLAEAQRIYDEFLRADAPTPINAPTPVREAVGDLLKRQGNVPAAGPAPVHGNTLALPGSNPAVAGNGSTAASADPLPCSARLHGDLFNLGQQFVLEHLQSAVLPGYLLHSQSSEAAVARNFKLKSELSDADKKSASCFNCLASFGLLKRRYFCRYCGDVVCASCLTKSSTLPPEYGVSDPIKLCDMCHTTLEISQGHPHAFSYANKGRSRPINLAASSPQEVAEWVRSLRACIQRKAALIAGGEAAAGPAPANREGWLMKEDPTTGIWRRRYFILNGSTGQLFYYELNLKGSLSLAQGAGVHSTTQKATLPPGESCFGGVALASGFAWRFTISYNTRLYALAADTADSQERWMIALHRAIRRSKPGGHGAGGLSALLQSREMANPSPYNSASGSHPALVPQPSPGGAQFATPSGTSSAAEAYSSSFAQRAPEGEVTFVFTDVQNSTKLWEAAADGMNAALEKHDALLRMLLAVYNGYEVKTEGDAFMVTFFSPLDAVRWCLAVQQALLEHRWPQELLKQPSGNQEFKDGVLIFNGLRIRMGIHYGYPACRRNPITGRMDYFNSCVNKSARVSDSAHGGQVVCTSEVRERIASGLRANEFPSAATAPVLSDLGWHKYKGIAETVQVFQISNAVLDGRNPFPPLRTTKADEPDHALQQSQTQPQSQTEGSAITTASASSAAAAAAAVDAAVSSIVVALPSLHLGASSSPSSSSAVTAAGQSPSVPSACASLSEIAPAPGLLSPSRPSHLTINSISALPIHPFTPSAAASGSAGGTTGAATGTAAAGSTEVSPVDGAASSVATPPSDSDSSVAGSSGGPDSDESADGSDSDEEEEEDERLAKEMALAQAELRAQAATADTAAAPPLDRTLTPDASLAGFMSPSPAAPSPES